MDVLCDAAGECVPVVNVDEVQNIPTNPHVPREAQVRGKRVTCLSHLAVDEGDSDAESTFVEAL